MRLNLYLCLLVTIILCLSASCSKKDDTPNIINTIAELPEYKREVARIDSLKKLGRRTEIQISIPSGAFDPEDSLKNISHAFIEENIGVDQIILYDIRFDKTTEEIMSISKL